jgi:hypothetical protein
MRASRSCGRSGRLWFASPRVGLVLVAFAPMGHRAIARLFPPRHVVSVIRRMGAFTAERGEHSYRMLGSHMGEPIGGSSSHLTQEEDV